MSSFNEMQFEKKLQSLKDSQDSIQTLSSWCLQHRQFHKKIVGTWLRVLKKVKIEHRLTLFYLANDVIQYSKRKNYEFVESWGTALQRATTMVREEKVKHRILRIFKIWDERGIYDEAFIADLCGLISTTTKKSAPESNAEPFDFQPSSLINKIRNCKKFEDDTDLKFKRVKDSHLSLSDADALRSHLKDRRQGDDVVAEVDDGVNKLQGYIKALELEIKERGELIEILESGQVFYDNQKGEAKVVANAYKNFGNRVKNLKRRLDELTPTLKDVSPLPSPPNVEDAPSPSPDSDVDLPGLNAGPDSMFMNPYPPTTLPTLTATQEDPPQQKSADNNFTSFMGGALPFDVQKNLFNESSGGILSPSPEPVAEDPSDLPDLPGLSASEGKPIEVISSRTKPEESFNITDFLKSLIPPRTDTIPGLSLDSNEEHSDSPGLAKPPYTDTPDILSQPSTEYEYPPATSTTTPLQPPPIPPSLFALEGNNQYKYSQTQDAEDSWNTKLPPKFPTWGETTNPAWETQEGGEKISEWMPVMPVNKVPPPEIVDTPESPPMYEKEGFSDPVEYDDSVIENTLMPPPADVDHRTLVALPLANHSLELSGPRKGERLEDTDHRLLLHIQPTNHVKKDIDHRPMLHRKKDVDHRNLISLTGSPMRESHAPLAPPPTPPNLPWPKVDQDYRSQVPRKPRESGVKPEGSTAEDVDYRAKIPKQKVDDTQDNVESVDMEMSDDEGAESSAEMSGTKLENSPMKNMGGDPNSPNKSTISFNINAPAKVLSNSPLNEIKEDPSRSRNRVYGCQRIPTIGGGMHAPRMMRGPMFPPPGAIPRMPMPPSPRSLRPNLLTPPPFPPQFNSVRIRPIAELVQIAQDAGDVKEPNTLPEPVASDLPASPLEKTAKDAEPSTETPPVTEDPAAATAAENIPTAAADETQPPWNAEQEPAASTGSVGSDTEAASASDSSAAPARVEPEKIWTENRSSPELCEPWMLDNFIDFEVHEVERLNSYDRNRGRGRGILFNKNFTPMPPVAQALPPRGGFGPRGRPGWMPRRGQVPPPPPPPPPPRFPFRLHMDQFRGHRGFKPHFRGNPPRHFGGW